ncbi:hypothetical protein [Streptomyces tubercidicus]|uniref:hypothetical protein n=1 Tax=Streptomyces tubercidicus TaxID=47759 RepID=UPI003466B974
MTSRNHHSTPSSSSCVATALPCVTGLALLVTAVAVIVLALTGNVGHVGTMLGIGAAAAAMGGTSVHICIHVRR